MPLGGSARRTGRVGGVALAVPLLVVAGAVCGAGRAAAAPEAGRVVTSAEGGGIGVAVCVDGRIVRRLVRLDVSLPLLPVGGLTVRVGEPCGGRTPSGGSTPTQPPPTQPPPTTPTPSATPTRPAPPPSGPPSSGSPTAGPVSVPPAPPSSRTPADRGAVRPGSPSHSSPAYSPSPSPSLSPVAVSVSDPASASASASDDGKPGRAGGRPSVEPFDGQAAPASPDAGDGAARWWLLSMLAMLLPAALAALPRLTHRRG
ncbi:hypothetical protein ABZ901_03460 [Actinacidiphila alni]|uniref:hypothetical protein n=1 Tax=Actinacidiphila alni TaxID=380248 RepID=UPI0033C9CCE7